MASDSDSEWEAEGGEQLEEEDDGDDESFHEDDEDEDGFAARHRNSEDGDDDTKKPAAATSVVRIGGFKPKTKKELVENTEDGAAAAGTAAAEDGASCSTTTCGNKNSRSDNRKRLRRVDFDAEGETDEIDHLPTHQRITVAGGYSHTKNSRLKISQANKGKSPWNKGKNRSETAKAKISAGVRARNHAVLLVKLSKLNMTAEEWFAKKRQIKLLRERVRKSKVAAKKHEENKTTEMKNVALQQEFDDLVQELETDDDGNDVEINNEGKVSCCNCCRCLFFTTSG